MHGLLQALDHAHQHAIVHRDVKPENVMLSGLGVVKVADFGIARLTDDSATSHATKTGTTVGTPQYMSPEQVTTSKVDGRSDLYSAGIVCYEVFCGRPPSRPPPQTAPSRSSPSTSRRRRRRRRSSVPASTRRSRRSS